MEGLREQFFKVYTNIPLSLREDIVLVLPEKGIITWNVAYFEIKGNSKYASEILNGLNSLGFI